MMIYLIENNRREIDHEVVLLQAESEDQTEQQ